MTTVAVPRNPYGPAPLRRPASIRRTSSIDVGWPDGHGGRMCLEGRGRDLLTPADGSPARLCAEDRIEVIATPMLRAYCIDRLLGSPLPGLRRNVLDALKGAAGCTHLNDAPRALAEVASLVNLLPGLGPDRLTGGFSHAIQ